ncbi:hypothetical protein [Hydrogenimonas thermophila]|nr:hypothetical protein [Hydrogenimonas thermophila]
MTVSEIVIGIAVFGVVVCSIICIDRLQHKKRIKNVWKGKLK